MPKQPLPPLPAAASDKASQPVSLSTTVAPGTLSSPDAQMGEQLTLQYHRATGGMREVLIFGAMMLQLEATLSARGQGDGNGKKGDGVKGWLEEFAPGVKRATAYRFKSVAESVQKDFALPAKMNFVQLATSSPEELDERSRSKQIELFDFVNGTSQRSWLDRFTPVKSSTGSGGKTKKLSAAEQHAAFVEQCREESTKALNEVLALNRTEKWKVGLSDAQIEALADELTVFAKALRKWVAVPQRDRPQIDPETALQS